MLLPSLLLPSLLVPVLAVQEWLQKPRNVTVAEGQDAVLVCKVSNKVGRCYWRKNSRLIYLYPGKYDWEGDPGQGDCSLRIHATKAQFDSGLWQCTVTATTYQGRIYFRDTLESDQVALVVTRAPSHAEIRRRDDVSGSIAGVVGRELEVECVAYGGSPAPTILWHFGGDKQVA